MNPQKNTIARTITSPARCASGPHIIGLNKILVPIDFSNRSKKALQYAIRFAEQFKASLVLQHVLTQPAATDAEYADEWKLRLKAWAYEFVPGHIPVQIDVSCGVKMIEILNEAKNLVIDLMIISTHGRMGRAHALAGSLAEGLVQLAPCPVLVIHEHEHDFIETREFETSLVSQDSPVRGVDEAFTPNCLGADI
ncbi:MAG TPA: universal stress protein [Verrucomicrobiae bacterium]|nr:universal stress protein [Verrucomicrobiae bacterium]